MASLSGVPTGNQAAGCNRRETFMMKIIDFVKKNNEIFIANFIVLGFIAIILLAQFGVHIEVDKGVDLVPVEIHYSQSTQRISGKTVYVSEGYVRLKYENDAQKSFGVPASVVFGRASVDDIEDMIKDGESIKRNVFYNTKSNEVIGVTKSGKSILSLYYCNSKIFRYGIWILFLVDIFVGFIIISHKEKTIDISQYRYYPEDQRKLELDEIIRRMRDFRLLYIFAVPVWAAWGGFTSVLLFAFMPESVANDILVIRITAIFVWLIVPLGTITVLKLIARNMDKKKDIIRNAYKYLSNVGDDFLELLQADLYKGLRFKKKHNLVISDSYIIGSITNMVFSPMAIPKDQIREIAYAYYSQATIKYHFVIQEVYFRIKNGKEIMMPVGDRYNLGLTLKALEDCGVPIIDISQEKKYGKAN